MLPICLIIIFCIIGIILWINEYKKHVMFTTTGPTSTSTNPLLLSLPPSSQTREATNNGSHKQQQTPEQNHTENNTLITTPYQYQPTVGTVNCKYQPTPPLPPPVDTTAAPSLSLSFPPSPHPLFTSYETPPPLPTHTLASSRTINKQLRQYVIAFVLDDVKQGWGVRGGGERERRRPSLFSPSLSSSSASFPLASPTPPSASLSVRASVRRLFHTSRYYFFTYKHEATLYQVRRFPTANPRGHLNPAASVFPS